jgi:hypothetical protein
VLAIALVPTGALVGHEHIVIEKAYEDKSSSRFSTRDPFDAPRFARLAQGRLFVKLTLDSG